MGHEFYNWTPLFAEGTHYYLKFNVLNSDGMEVDFRLSDEFIYGDSESDDSNTPTPVPVSNTPTPIPDDTAIADLRVFPPTSYSMSTDVGTTKDLVFKVQNNGLVPITGRIDVSPPLSIVSGNGSTFSKLINGSVNFTIRFAPQEVMDVEQSVRVITDAGDRTVVFRLTGLALPSTPIPTSTPTPTPTPTNTPTQPPLLPNQIFFTDFESGDNGFMKEDDTKGDYPEGSATFEIADGLGYNNSRGLALTNTAERLLHEVQAETITGINIVHGTWYRVNFSARSIVDATILLDICHHGKPYTSFGLNKSVDIGGLKTLTFCQNSITIKTIIHP